MKIYTQMENTLKVTFKKGIMSEIYEEILKLNCEKIKYTSLYTGQTLHQINIWVTNKHMKRCLFGKVDNI